MDVDRSGRVTLTDLGSANGTGVNGVRLDRPRAIGPGDLVCLGGTVLLHVIPVSMLGPSVPVDPMREARGAGTPHHPRSPTSYHVPRGRAHCATKPAGRSGGTFSISMMLGPVAMAGAFVGISGDARYAFIAALTPLMLVANYFEERTRGRRGLRRRVREFRTKLDGLRRTLFDEREHEIRRRCEAGPDLADLAHHARAPSPRLWERRPGADDFLRSSVGTAPDLDATGADGPDRCG